MPGSMAGIREQLSIIDQRAWAVRKLESKAQELIRVGWRPDNWPWPGAGENWTDGVSPSESLI